MGSGPRNRNLPNSERRFVHDVFSGGSPGDWFGKEMPALIAKDTSSGELLFVIPHEVQSSHFFANIQAIFRVAGCYPHIRFVDTIETELRKTISVHRKKNS